MNLNEQAVEISLTGAFAPWDNPASETYSVDYSVSVAGDREGYDANNDCLRVEHR
jgi:hypothetical protein